jgi:predicted metal-binding membrane protein
MWHGMNALEAVLKRDRAIVVAGLIGISTLSWAYTIDLAGGMSHSGAGHESVVLPQMGPWASPDPSLLFVMWVVMMIAMMVPTASQMILTFTAIARKQSVTRSPAIPTALFLLGYVIAWTGYAAGATLGQSVLHRAALISPAGMSANSIFGGTILVVAGIFQWTPLKYACRSRCRSPFAFLMTEWRPGSRGALVMGLRHGVYCVICCWALMALMFVLGMMNLLWLAAITVFVLLEKVVPAGHVVAHVAGIGLLGWGLYLLSLGLLG